MTQKSKHKRKPVSEETKRNMSEAHKGKKHPHKGKPHTEEQKRKQSEATKGKQRKPLSEKTKKANGQKLSIHHVDMDKAQGCESNWKLVPLCKHCHATAHNDEIIARLGYLLKRDSGWLER